MDKGVTITGSRGFIGTKIRSLLNSMSIAYSEIDHSLGSDLKGISEQNGTLIHLAASIHEDESFRDPTKYINNNINDLARILMNNSFGKVIFPSSSSVYDPKGNLNPKSVYGITKLAGEFLIKIYCKNYWILRITNPYGEGDRKSVFAKLARCKMDGNVFTIYRSDAKKNFFCVDHVIDVISDILSGNIPCGVYNVGSNESYVVSDLLESICKKNNVRYEFVDPPKGLSSGYVPHENLLSEKKRSIGKEWKNYLL